MKVAIFPETDELFLVGFATEEHMEFPFFESHRLVVELTEEEVTELEEARLKFNEAQRKLGTILRRARGMSEEQIAEYIADDSWGNGRG